MGFFPIYACALFTKYIVYYRPENVPRLFDLVKPKSDKYLTTFYWACRETLVSTDTTQGSRIAYGKQRQRVVTLNGEMFETSGKYWDIILI